MADNNLIYISQRVSWTPAMYRLVPGYMLRQGKSLLIKNERGREETFEPGGDAYGGRTLYRSKDDDARFVVVGKGTVREDGHDEDVEENKESVAVSDDRKDN